MVTVAGRYGEWTTVTMVGEGQAWTPALSGSVFGLVGVLSGFGSDGPLAESMAELLVEDAGDGRRLKGVVPQVAAALADGPHRFDDDPYCAAVAAVKTSDRSIEYLRIGGASIYCWTTASVRRVTGQATFGQSWPPDAIDPAGSMPNQYPVWLDGLFPGDEQNWENGTIEVGQGDYLIIAGGSAAWKMDCNVARQPTRPSSLLKCGTGLGPRGAALLLEVVSAKP